ncbi:MAG: hypothetical protein JNM46_00635 [Anaerolineales bacterium]|nr:hypothetical protein [Anaerolineales bacterium]
MLTILTYFVTLISMGGALWLALYLFARGFPNRIAMWATFALLSMATFFWLTYNHFFNPQINTGYIKAIFLSLALVSWYIVTYYLLEKTNQQKILWLVRGIYLMVLITIIMLLLNKPDFARRYENELYVAQLGAGFVYYFYSLTQLILSIGLMTNLLVEQKIRFTPQGRLFLFASIFPTLAVFYGIISLIASGLPMPRVIQDGLVFSGFFLLGISVTRYQSLLERRTIFQDFPLTFLIVASLCVIYIYYFQTQISQFANMVGFVILTHSAYDLTREFLERYRAKHEESFRKQVLRIKPQESQTYLQDALILFCKQIKTNAGIVATRSEEKFFVTATSNSVSVGSEVLHPDFADATIAKFSGHIQNIEWVASVFDNKNQIAFVGIGAPLNRMDYSTGELDLLEEFADYATLMLLVDSNIKKEDDITSYQIATAEIIETLTSAPDEKIIKMTEDGLRKFPDYVTLGQSELAKWLKVNGNSHIDRGKKLQTILREGVEALRPTGPRPEPLPRNWYNYVVLNDAYIKGIMNKEVMARLYISEGTFNRTRRNALRGVARWLIEKKTTFFKPYD